MWLDKNKTSSYAIYQYLVNSDDNKVEEYLKVFTFLSPEEIMDVMRQHKQTPEQRIAQKTLAKEFIKDHTKKVDVNDDFSIAEAYQMGQKV